MIHVHGGTIAHIVQTRIKESEFQFWFDLIMLVEVAADLHCCGEPLKCLTSVAIVVSFNMIKGVKHRNGVNDEDNMMNRIEELVRDTVSEIRCSSDDKKSGKNDIAGDHDFISELITKSLFTISTQDPKEKEKEDCGKENN